jgi:hypothetical protein
MQGADPVARTAHRDNTHVMSTDHTDQPRAPVRLTLELRPQGDGLAGSLYDEIGSHHRFAGWLDLLTLLEAARLRTQIRPTCEG